MKIALYVRPDNIHQPQVEALLSQRSLAYAVNPKETEDCSHAISLGGDGTFLSAVRRMGASKRLPLLGINSGRLGFLATVSLDHIEAALDCLPSHNYDIEQRSMIAVQGIENCNSGRTTALNEFTIQKSGTSMIHIDMFFDDILAASYWADGVIVSTPTGSTAYSMSVAGAILTPECHCFIISPIAPHNLSLRPLIIPDNSNLSIRVTTRDDRAVICTLDNREYEAPSGTFYHIGRSPECQQIISLAGNNFYNTLRDKLLWGVDRRN